MSRFEDFKPGEYVAHLTAGDGVVIAVDEYVRVVFDKKKRDRSRVAGAYDRAWFQAHPNHLFHRSRPK